MYIVFYTETGNASAKGGNIGIFETREDAERAKDAAKTAALAALRQAHADVTPDAEDADTVWVRGAGGAISARRWSVDKI